MIELAGLPASGKTTLFGALRDQCERRGMPFSEIGDVFDQPVPKRSAPRFVARSADREMLYRGLEFRRAHPELSAYVDGLLDTPATATLHFLFWMLASRFQGRVARGSAYDALFLDEGFVQHGTAMCLASGDMAGFERYIALMPQPRAVLMIEVDPETAYLRALERRGKQSIQTLQAKHGTLRDFLKRRQMLDRAATLLRDRGTDVIHVPQSNWNGATMDNLVDALAQALGAGEEIAMAAQ